MRRTLALAGVAVLVAGIGALAGPASADTGIAQQETDALLSEIAVDLDPASGFEGSFIELINPSETNSVSLDDYELSTCSATGPLTTIVSVLEFDFTHVVAADGTFLIADVTFRDGPGPVPDIVVQDLGLDQSDGGAMLTDTSASLNDPVKWGEPFDSSVDPDCAEFPDAQNPVEGSINPSDMESINRDLANDNWFLNDPTP